VELVRDVENLALQMLECGLIACTGLRMIEPVGRRLDQRFDVLRHWSDMLDTGVEGLRQVVDTLCERVEAGRASAFRDMVDAGRERLHVAGKRGDAFRRSDAGGQFG